MERGYKRIRATGSVYTVKPSQYQLLISVIARHCLSLNARKTVKTLFVIISQ